MDRLSRIPSIIEMPYNEAVRKFIDMYAVRLRNKVSFMLAATNFYMPIFEEALDLYDLPQELKYLPIIESALNPVAVSRQGATGLWQFMLGTGKIYGLKNNSLIDEHLSRLESGIGSLQLRAGHYQQSHTPCRRSHGLLDNLQLSAQRNPWVRSCFHSGKLHHDLLLRTWHLSHGNTASQRYRHHSH